MTDLLPEARVIAAILGHRGLLEGRVYEEPDGLTWTIMESNDVARAVAEGRDPGEVLIDTGWWQETEGPFPDDLRAELIAAYRG
jgi:hypothetical protein